MTQPIRVAVVEDNDPLRAEIVRTINAAPDLRCIAACASAESACAELPLLRPDVVLMDVQLHALSGIDCVKALKPRLPTTQIMMLTILDDHERIFQAVLAGASGYLLKSTPAAELVAAIRLLHSGGAPMTSSIARKVLDAFRELATRSQPVENLTTREHEILDLVARGKRAKDIAHLLGLSHRTVETHLGRIYGKLHVSDADGALLARRRQRCS